MMMRNHEGYPDPTAGTALRGIEQEERARKLGYMPLAFTCLPLNVPGCAVDDAHRYSAFALSQGALPVAPGLLFPPAEDDEARERNLYMSLILLKYCQEVWYFGDTIDGDMRTVLLKAARRDMVVRHFSGDCREEESFDLRSGEQESQL
jgi:hypothetical protein